MKVSLLPLSFLLVSLFSSAAFADHISLSPNDGSGGNFSFTGRFNGHPLSLYGGTPADFFGLYVGYAPGSTFGGQTALFLNESVVWIDGMPTSFFFYPGTLFISSFTLPTNDRGFTIPVEIGFSATGINFDTGQTIDVGGGAVGQISFSFSNGLYYPNSFVQAPEPGTLGFVGTGMVGIVGAFRRRLWR